MKFENDLAIFKVQLKIAFKDKFYFVYTLIVPIFMIFINKTQDFQDNESLYIYWSYIVVTTVFNGFLLNIIRLRESGFFKTLTYLMGSKYSIVLSNLFVQVVIIQLEILLFNLIVFLFIIKVSLMTFIYGFLATFLATFLVSAMLSGALLIRIRKSTFNLFCGIFFILGIALLGSRPSGVIEYVQTVLNPFQLIYGLYIFPCSTVGFQILIMLCVCGYLLIGAMMFKNISIKQRLK